MSQLLPRDIQTDCLRIASFVDFELEGKTKTSRPQSGEDFLEGVPGAGASSQPKSGTPLSIVSKPRLQANYPTLNEFPDLGPCDLACGTCLECRAFEALKNRSN
jgi:hypothetical protein